MEYELIVCSSYIALSFVQVFAFYFVFIVYIACLCDVDIVWLNP